MAQRETISMAVYPEEKATLDALATHLAVNRSDALRFLIRQTARELGIVEHAAPKGARRPAQS